ncbi:MAG TPA: NYN domain-containing protein [Actinomycetota bacterium]|nr:NYN domain-containing protein [Actinomycetota bacterium]
MDAEEQRIALFIDFENLAIGARDRGETLDMAIIMNALSERGRVVVRRAYADWNLFADMRQNLVAQRIEMIEIPQRTGMVRKNAADIKLAVDALELVFERDFLTTFVVASGDSDFTPLVLKLRELNKSVIGVGVEGSTSELLPGACDEFLFYGKLLGVGSGKAAAPRGRQKKAGAASNGGAAEAGGSDVSDLTHLTRLVFNTLLALQRTTDGSVLSSMIKRAILRKDPTFAEGDYGFRTWGELMRHLESKGAVTLRDGVAEGDPLVDVPSGGETESQAFDLLRTVVSELQKSSGEPPLSGLKDQLRKRKPNFSEKDLGYGGFLQFVKAARAKGIVDMNWDDAAEDYYVRTI